MRSLERAWNWVFRPYVRYDKHGLHVMHDECFEGLVAPPCKNCDYLMESLRKDMEKNTDHKHEYKETRYRGEDGVIYVGKTCRVCKCSSWSDVDLMWKCMGGRRLVLNRW